MALSVLRLLKGIIFDCIPYFKDSTVGNCYTEEYVALNGRIGQQLVFNREIGSVGLFNLQCRANDRAGAQDLENMHPCRKKFRFDPGVIGRVARCATPAFAKASANLDSCTRKAFGFIATSICINKFNIAGKFAFIQCIPLFGTPAVAAASLSMGFDALNCPALRRDAFIGICKAPDWV